MFAVDKIRKILTKHLLEVAGRETASQRGSSG